MFMKHFKLIIGMKIFDEILIYFKKVAAQRLHIAVEYY